MKKLLSWLFLTFSLASSYSQNAANMKSTVTPPMQQIAPMIGAEIFIEPGQTAEEIDTWYRLTAYYDEHAHCIMKTGFSFEKLFGADIREFKLEGNLFDVSLNDPSLKLPGHCWRGTLAVTTAKPIGFNNQEVVAARNVYGNGEVLWIPGLIGLAGRIQGYASLSALLYNEADAGISSVPFRFKAPAAGMLMKTLQSWDSFITVIINKSGNSFL